MYLPDFEYLAPATLEEASALLEEYGPRARVLAGGTDLLVKMKNGLLEPEVLVSLKNIPGLREIRYEPGRGVVIGALATHNDLINSPLLQQKYLSVSQAAHSMAAYQVRNQGTIGGNLCNAVPSADLPPILIALAASAVLTSRRGERTLPLEEFFTGPNRTVLAPGEILTAVVIPDQPTTGSTYHKFGLRRSGALAVVGVAAAVTVRNDVVEDARIALGAVAPTPMRAREAENVVRGRVPTEEVLRAAGEAAARECRPISDLRGSEEYRRHLVGVFTRRALQRAITEGHV